MMDSNFKAITVITLTLLALVNCICKSTTYIAYESGKDIEYLNYQSNEDCSFEIKPSKNHHKYFDYSKYFGYKYTGYEQRFDYFLEISWKSFHLRGKMPNCNNDYVQVFLTRSEKSIGRFCSDNLISSSLFKMYSYDGYAKIKFHSDASMNGKGFKFNIRLRETSDYLNYWSSSSCNRDFASPSGNFFSPKWPHEYNIDRDKRCLFKIDSVGEKKIILMDVSLKKTSQGAMCYPYQDDNVQIRGSSSNSQTFELASKVKDPVCSTNGIVSMTTTERYVYIRIAKQTYGESGRGIVAGYVTYNKEGAKSPNSLTGTSTNWFVIIIGTAGSLCFIAIIIGITCCCRYKRKKALNERTTAASVPNVTYSSFQPSVGYQGPYQSSQTHIGDAPPAYSSYQGTFPTYTHQVPGGQVLPTDVYYRSPPAYNPEYVDHSQQ